MHPHFLTFWELSEGSWKDLNVKVESDQIRIQVDGEGVPFKITFLIEIVLLYLLVLNRFQRSDTVVGI